MAKEKRLHMSGTSGPVMFHTLCGLVANRRNQVVPAGEATCRSCRTLNDPRPISITAKRLARRLFDGAATLTLTQSEYAGRLRHAMAMALEERGRQFGSSCCFEDCDQDQFQHTGYCIGHLEDELRFAKREGVPQ